jgi:hypothetical protein
MRCRFPRTNNTNSFFIFAIRISVDNHQDHYGLDHPDRVPSLLTILEPVRHDEMKRIVEHLLGEIERDTVLGKIAPSFFRIPFELQSSTINYNNVRTIS